MILFDRDKEKDVEYLSLNEEQIDVLKEIGNIGSGNAITALSQLLNKPTDMSLTYVNIIPFWKLPYIFGDPSKLVFGVNSKISNHKASSILQFFTKESILGLINILYPTERNKIHSLKRIEELDEMSLSIITEIGNILAGHYSSSLADLMSIKLIPDVPLISFDVIGAMTNCIIAKSCQFADYSIIIDTKLKIEDINLEGVFCFICDFSILRKFFQSLNIECLF